MTDMNTKTLTWSEAVEQALVPTDLDFKLVLRGAFGTGDPIVGENGQVADWRVVRHRAVHAYVKAHEGEAATVSYVNPYHVADATRLVYSTTGVLRCQYVSVPVFTPGDIKATDGFIVGSTVVPLDGVSSIHVEGDNSTVVL